MIQKNFIQTFSWPLSMHIAVRKHRKNYIKQIYACESKSTTSTSQFDEHPIFN